MPAVEYGGRMAEIGGDPAGSQRGARLRTNRFVALWRLGHYIRPWRVKVAASFLAALLGVAASTCRSAVIEAIVNGPIKRGDAAAAGAAVPRRASASGSSRRRSSSSAASCSGTPSSPSSATSATTSTPTCNDSRSVSTTAGEPGSCCPARPATCRRSGASSASARSISSSTRCSTSRCLCCSSRRTGRWAWSLRHRRSR